jgi:large subunit ribosomal protein L14
MIQKTTVLNIADNTGAYKVKCIHVYQGYRRRYANVGDIIKVAVQRMHITQHQKINKGSVVRALVLTTKNVVRKKSGYSCKFNQNNAAIFKEKTNKFLGNRIFIPALTIFRKTRFLRLITLASGTIL